MKNGQATKLGILFLFLQGDFLPKNKHMMYVISFVFPREFDFFIVSDYKDGLSREQQLGGVQRDEPMVHYERKIHLIALLFL